MARPPFRVGVCARLPDLKSIILSALLFQLVPTLLITATNAAPPADLRIYLPTRLFLLALALLALHLSHEILVALTIQRHDLKAGQIHLQKRAQMGEHLPLGPVGAGVVVDNEFVVVRVAGRFGCEWAASYFLGGMSDVVVDAALSFALSSCDFFFNVAAARVRFLEAPDEEFAGECNVNAYVAVHSVFAEQINSILLTRFGKSP